jgi:hypothetical protein
MATPSGAEADAPDPSRRLSDLSEQLTPALRDLNEKLAEQPMLELKNFVHEFEATEPELARAAEALVEFSDCLFTMARSADKEELRSVIGRLEKCIQLLPEAKGWKEGIEFQVLQGKSRLRKLEAQEVLAEIAALDEAQRKGLRQLAEDSDPGSFERLTLQGIVIYLDACELLAKASAAQAQMELEAAGAYLEEASAKLNSALQNLSTPHEESTIVTLMKGITSGLDAWAGAQRTYALVLQKALTGGANADSLVDLERAEQIFLKTGITIQQSAAQLARITNQPGADFAALGEQLSRVARNLRQLCFSALRPRSVAAQTAPRFFAFFMIAFIVLVAGMRLSGLVMPLNAGSLSGLLGICITVSSVSSFGLDGIRVVRAMLVEKRAAPQQA